jgi:2-dehydropantoate 2-reductase
MRVLTVGDGALGQVYGSRLATGGASVSYLVKPGRAWQERTLRRLRRWRAPVVERLRPDAVLTDPAGDWDMVWLCVSSTALRGPWLRDLLAATGAATVVSIGQDVRDLAVLTEVWPAEQIVQIVQVAPTVLAFPTDAGMAYWLPPGARNGVSGDRARLVMAALRAGGLGARTARPGSGELTAARMVPYIAALDAADWSPRAPLGLAARASAEAVATLGGTLAPPAWLAGLALRVLPLVVPFDLGDYLRAHFTKVGAQTRLMLDGWIARGEARQLPVARLRELRRSLTP